MFTFYEVILKRNRFLTDLKQFIRWLLHCAWHLFAVVKANRLRCNDTVVFPANSSSMSLYVTIPHLLSPDVATGNGIGRSLAVPFSSLCPVYVQAQSGQRISMSVFMLGAGSQAYGNVNEIDATRRQYDDAAQSTRVSGSDGGVVGQSAESWHLQQRRRHLCQPDNTGWKQTVGGVYVVDYGRRQVVGELCNLPRYTLTGRSAQRSSIDTSGGMFGTAGAGLYTSIDSTIGIYVGGSRENELSDAVRDRVGDSDMSWVTSLGSATDRTAATFIVRVEGKTGDWR